MPHAYLFPALVLAATAGALGPELRHEGWSLRPPEGFTLQRPAVWASGSQVGAAAVEAPGVARALSAVLADGEGPDAAVLLVARVDAPLGTGPSARDDFAAAVLAHWTRELGLAPTLLATRRTEGPEPRLEVEATLREAGQVRVLLASAVPGPARHAVLTASVPLERWPALAPDVRAAVATFRWDAAAAPGGGVALGLAVALLGALLLASWAAWRRRTREGQGRGGSLR